MNVKKRSQKKQIKRVPYFLLFIICSFLVGSKNHSFNNKENLMRFSNSCSKKNEPLIPCNTKSGHSLLNLVKKDIHLNKPTQSKKNYQPSHHTRQHRPIHEWGIVGGGPAGIIAIAALRDIGVDPSSIIAFDPDFELGNMGKHYQEIFSNTLVRDYLKTFLKVKSLQFPETMVHLEKIMSYGLDNGFPLRHISDTLRIASEHFKKEIVIVNGTVEHIVKSDNGEEYDDYGYWNLHVKDNIYLAKKVILATGSIPKVMEDMKDKAVDLFDILNSDRRKLAIKKDDVVAVFGSSHTAVLIMRLLLEDKVKKIINFYRTKNIKNVNSFFHYNASEGLGQHLKEWAIEHIEKNPPDNLIRVFNSSEKRKLYADEITKVVYAIGFDPVQVSIVDPRSSIHFDDRNGRLGHHLYGLGIAYPEGFVDLKGYYQRKVEVVHFIDHALRCVPLWNTD